jgi:hypothetical protein
MAGWLQTVDFYRSRWLLVLSMLTGIATLCLNIAAVVWATYAYQAVLSYVPTDDHNDDNHVFSTLYLNNSLEVAGSSYYSDDYYAHHHSSNPCIDSIHTNLLWQEWFNVVSFVFFIIMWYYSRKYEYSSYEIENVTADELFLEKVTYNIIRIFTVIQITCDIVNEVLDALCNRQVLLLNIFR